jgi:two-component system chemotaxis response regulator CheB
MNQGTINRIRVLVVDDSAFMRRAIAKMLETEPNIVVAATARSGEEALEKAAQVRPDVITMDVEMPGIGGLEAVREITARQRVPIIMVSALTQEGAETTFRALELGAVDFVAKPDAAYDNINDVARDLVAKVLTFGQRTVVPHPKRALEVARPKTPPRVRVARRAGIEYECVAIGTSTGGPVALSRIIPALPSTFATPIVIVQHMPLGFTRPLSERLNAQSKITVIEAADGMPLEAATAYVIPSGRQSALERSHGKTIFRLIDDDGSSLHVPSVDVMTDAVAERYGAHAVGVILTGMGQDGVQGLRKLKARGGYVLGQDEQSCVVYGMPRAAERAGLVDRILPLTEISAALCDLTRSPFAES